MELRGGFQQNIGFTVQVFFCTDVVLDNGTKQCLDVFPLVLLVQQLIETTAQNACSEQRVSCTFYLISKWSLPPIVLINGLYVPKLNFSP